MGELFFGGAANGSNDALRPRLFPLIAGPTGVGKSFLIEQISRDLGCGAYSRITRGDFTVQHSRYGIPTIYSVISLAAVHKKILVHVDELDKFSNMNGGSEWAASISSDLYNLLDRRFPIDEFLNADFPGATAMAARKMSRDELEKRVQTNVWIVGSGTWQQVFDQPIRNAPIGFGASECANLVGSDDIVNAEVIAPELLARFNSDLVILRYPERDELEILLEKYGIKKLAKRAGVSVTADDLAAMGGMRALETCKTRLLIKLHVRSPKSR